MLLVLVWALLLPPELVSGLVLALPLPWVLQLPPELVSGLVLALPQLLQGGRLLYQCLRHLLQFRYLSHHRQPECSA